MLYLPIGHGRPTLTAAVPTAIYRPAAHRHRRCAVQQSPPLQCEFTLPHTPNTPIQDSAER